MLVPAERFELPTNGLQNRCSTTELSRHRKIGARGLAGYKLYRMSTYASVSAGYSRPCGLLRRGSRLL